MSTKTMPFGNNVLIEVQREYDGVSRMDDNESLKVGRLIRVSIGRYHLTASSALRFLDEDTTALALEFDDMIGSLVRWEEFAEGGQTFMEDGKTYALIPWWRIISYQPEAKSE